MRLTTLIIIATLVQVSAASLAQKVSLSKNNATLKSVLKDIRTQCGYNFIITESGLKEANPVNINIKDADLKDVLDKIFNNQPLTYSINKTTITINQKQATFLDNIKAAFAAVDVQGRVFDDKGQPLPGATITVKNKNQVTTTDENGVFVLKRIDADAVLVISFVGFKSFEISAKADLKNIKLEIELGALKEVSVNVISNGYQTIAKERSAGSFAQPDMTVFTERSATNNVLQRLDGLIPGLVINNAPTNALPAQQNPILVRGLSSLNGSRTPLYVVDGVAVQDVSTINPNDVGSITVLKDATAASIWGSRASNGVIVISTKKGGKQLKIDYDGSIVFQGKPDIGYFPVLNSQQYIDAAKALFNPTLFPYTSVAAPTRSIQTELPPHEQILYNQNQGVITADQANAQLAALASFNNVQQMKDLFYRNASISNQTVSVSGGSKNYSAYGSLSYINTTDQFPGDQNNRFKVNLRQDLQISKALKVYLVTDLTNDITKTLNNTAPDDRFFPYVNFLNADGSPAPLSWIYNPPLAQAQYESQSLISLAYSPITDANTITTNTNSLLNRINGGFDLKLIDGLNFQGTYGLVRGNSQTKKYVTQQNYQYRYLMVNFTKAAVAPSTTPTYYLPSTGDLFYNTNAKQQEWVIRNQLQYNKSWNNSKHQLTALFGQEAQDQLSNTATTTTFGYDPQLLTTTNLDYATLNSTGISGSVNNSFTSTLNAYPPYTEAESEQRFTSYYGNGAYTYNQKYTVNGSWRIDQSNLFGKDNSAQNRPVWSAGAAWLISDESFLKNVLWLNHLVLRGTYGITGNSPVPGTTASYDILAPQGSTLFPSGTSLTISAPANKKLTWETTYTTNFGLDFSILNNRLSGSIDVYNKNTENLIAVSPVNLLTGYASITGNIGNMNNKGVELGLNSLNVVTKNFSWRSLLTFSYNKNKITLLNLNTPITTGSQKLQSTYLPGYPAFAVFAYQYAGLDNLGDPQIRRADGTVTKARGVSTPADILFKGTYQPITTGGFSNFFTYRNFSLDVNMVYSLGAVMRRDANGFYTGRLTSGSSNVSTGNLAAEFANRWQNPGDEAFTNVPSYVAASATSGSRRDLTYYQLGDINVLSADYIKLRDANLTYSLPNAAVKFLHIAGLKVRGGISNVMLWKANKYGIDPEFQNSSAASLGGIRTVTLNQHTITLGLHASFN